MKKLVKILKVGKPNIVGVVPSFKKTKAELGLIKEMINKNKEVLYFSLELSKLTLFKNYSDMFPFLLSDKLIIIDECTSIDNMLKLISDIKPAIVVVDYLQVLESKFNIDTIDLFKTIFNNFNYYSKKNKCAIVIFSKKVKSIKKSTPLEYSSTLYKYSGTVTSLNEGFDGKINLQVYKNNFLTLIANIIKINR